MRAALPPGAPAAVSVGGCRTRLLAKLGNLRDGGATLELTPMVRSSPAIDPAVAFDLKPFWSHVRTRSLLLIAECSTRLLSTELACFFAMRGGPFTPSFRGSCGICCCCSCCLPPLPPLPLQVLKTLFRLPAPPGGTSTGGGSSLSSSAAAAAASTINLSGYDADEEFDPEEYVHPIQVGGWGLWGWEVGGGRPVPVDRQASRSAAFKL